VLRDKRTALSIDAELPELLAPDVAAGAAVAGGAPGQNRRCALKPANEPNLLPQTQSNTSASAAGACDMPAGYVTNGELTVKLVVASVKVASVRWLYLSGI